MTKKVVVLGALSDIAEATCRQYAAEKASLMLVGRDEARLQAVAEDLRVRGASDVYISAGDLVAMDARRYRRRASRLRRPRRPTLAR